MNNLSKNEKILIILGGGLIFFYLYFSIFLSPINDSLIKEGKILEAKNAEVTSIERLKLSNATNQKKLDQSIKKFNDSLKQLPKNDRNPEIAYNLNDLADKSKIAINSLNFGAIADYVDKNNTENKAQSIKTPNTPTTSQKLKLVPVNITISGEYVALLNFMSSIENVETGNRLAEIASVNISGKTEGKTGITATIVLNYYFSEGSAKEKPTYDNLKDNNVGKDNLFN